MREHERRGPTDGPLLLQHPTLSRSQIAFVFAGDLWIVDRDGGDARRLTCHPQCDQVFGWTPDGRQVLFGSRRSNGHWRCNRLFTMSLDAVFPTELPLPMAEEGSFSPDGSRLAYLPLGRHWLSRMHEVPMGRVPTEGG